MKGRRHRRPADPAGAAPAPAGCGGPCPACRPERLGPADRILVPRLGEGRPPRAVLFAGLRSAAAPLALHFGGSGARLRVSCLDSFDAERIGAQLAFHGAAALVSCEADLPAGPFDLVVLEAVGSFQGEYLADLVERAALNLEPGGKIIVSADRRAGAVGDQVRRVFGEASLERAEGAELALARRPPDVPAPKSRLSAFSMRLPGGLEIALQTRPGVFSHRQVDEGALALAETAVPESGDRLLDMGCGCGLIGIALARRAPLASLTFLDSSARAIACARVNCLANGVAGADFVLGHRGLDRPGRYTLFTGNPPYFADFAVARLFFETAHRSLRPGGRAFLVARSGEKLAAQAAGLFGKVEILPRRGYGVVRAVR